MFYINNTTYDDIGYFVARVFAAGGTIPIENAAVSVIKNTDSGRELSAFALTDKSGRTAVFSLPAPSRSNSESPDIENAFAVYDIEIEHPLYLRKLIKNAQVFSDVQTLQEVELIPLAQNANPEDETVVDVTKQNL